MYFILCLFASVLTIYHPFYCSFPFRHLLPMLGLWLSLQVQSPLRPAISQLQTQACTSAFVEQSVWPPLVDRTCVLANKPISVKISAGWKGACRRCSALVVLPDHWGCKLLQGDYWFILLFKQNVSAYYSYNRSIVIPWTHVFTSSISCEFWRHKSTWKEELDNRKCLVLL